MGRSGFGWGGRSRAQARTCSGRAQPRMREHSVPSAGKQLATPHPKHRQLLSQSRGWPKTSPCPPSCPLPPFPVTGFPFLLTDIPKLSGLPSLPGPAPPALHSVAGCPGAACILELRQRRNEGTQEKIPAWYSGGGRELVFLSRHLRKLVPKNKCGLRVTPISVGSEQSKCNWVCE